jgi:hypothetical protein
MKMEDRRSNPQCAEHYMAPCHFEDPGVKLIVQSIINEVLKDSPKSAKGAAGSVLRAVRKYAESVGHKPDIETFRRPEAGGYRVSYEAGPYDWAIPASYALCGILKKVVEPYYSFDLCFYNGEWRS